MWTKLIHLNIKKAFYFQRTKRSFKHPYIKRTDQKRLIKLFKRQGLPNIFQKPNFTLENHPWNQKPLGKDRKILRANLKHERVKSNLLKVEQEILQYRQQRINERPLKGLEKFLYEFGHSYANSLK